MAHLRRAAQRSAWAIPPGYRSPLARNCPRCAAVIGERCWNLRVLEPNKRRNTVFHRERRNTRSAT